MVNGCNDAGLLAYRCLVGLDRVPDCEIGSAWVIQVDNNIIDTTVFSFSRDWLNAS
jgi:hypothetical protein